MTHRVPTSPHRIKCVVWDLDHTLWDGILLEDSASTSLRPGVRHTLAVLDERGILHSIASRNDPHLAAARLRELGIADYFLYPQIGWGNKSAAVGRVAELLNIGIDSLAFIDDQELERDEVAFVHPEILCLDAAETATFASRPEFQPKYLTADSRMRRRMYQAGVERAKAEEQFAGTNDEFLATLGMRFTIKQAATADIGRAEELVVRTNQLNSTGIMYSAEELAAFAESDRHLLLMAELDDKYGTYGQVGVALIELGSREWTLKLLLMSCRVISRGVGTVLLNEVMRRAHAAGARLLAEFAATDRNRIMYVTYRFANFDDLGERDGRTLLAAPTTPVGPPPSYLTLVTE